MKKIFYLMMLSFLCCTAPHQELPTLIEIADSERRVSAEDLLKLCSVSPIGEHRIYHNETGWVIYCEGDNCGEIIQSLCTQWPGIRITCYRDPFYQFQRSAHCGETEGVPGNWDHVIMRANLVEDEKMQEEYMIYHQNQFDEWPEVSQGFCHAGFQRLLLFRSGRQLMLLISIPQGADFEQMNAKTVENNPRMNEWNNIMVQYQEGMENAPQGVVWSLYAPLQAGE